MKRLFPNYSARFCDTKKNVVLERMYMLYTHVEYTRINVWNKTEYRKYTR